jgi:hypothetical protein
MSRQSTKRTDAAVIMPILIPVLGEELAAAVIEHRDTLREPLTEYAAKLQVKEYIATGDPVAAAEMQILRGWRSIKNSWFQNEIQKDRRNQPKRSNDMANFAGEVMGLYRERISH